MLYIKHSCLAREDQPLPINTGERTHLTACPLTDAIIHAQRHIIISNKPAPIGAGCLLLLSPVVRSRQTAREQFCPGGAAGLLNAGRLDSQRSKAPLLKPGQTKDAGSSQHVKVSLLQLRGHSGTSGAAAWLPPSQPHTLCPGGPGYGGCPQGGVCRPPAPCTPGAPSRGPELISASPHCTAPSLQHHNPSSALLHPAQDTQRGGSR